MRPCSSLVTATNPAHIKLYSQWVGKQLQMLDYTMLNAMLRENGAILSAATKRLTKFQNCTCRCILQVKRILATGTPVRFNIRLKVEFGQRLVVVGGCGSLGAWNVDNAVRLTWQEGHVWEASVELPAG